jgi:hypothetical protein
MQALSPITIPLSQYLVRAFELEPGGSTNAPTPLADRTVEATDIDDARARTAELFQRERRPLRSLSCLADGAGLVAYVLPPVPEEQSKGPRRLRGRRR